MGKAKYDRSTNLLAQMILLHASQNNLSLNQISKQSGVASLDTFLRGHLPNLRTFRKLAFFMGLTHEQIGEIVLSDLEVCESEHDARRRRRQAKLEREGKAA